MIAGCWFNYLLRLLVNLRRCLNVVDVAVDIVDDHVVDVGVDIAGTLGPRGCVVN